MQTPPRVRRHLIDPANPPRPRPRSMGISQVQKWVLSALATTTVLHLAAGLVVAAAVVDDEHLGARVGLNVIAGLVGVVAVAVFLGIHQKAILSPWLALGLLVTPVGLLVTF